MYLKLIGSTAIATLLGGIGFTAESPLPWDMRQLEKAPAAQPAEGFVGAGMRAVFFDGLSWRNKPTRVFAWIGIPPHPEGAKVPGIVLVHGGGGTAFAEWVKLWTSRGYAAIAMDTCGAVPDGSHGKRHDHGGPPGWGDFEHVDESLGDQWTYHAVADAILAHSLLRAEPGVDPTRIGITGISWGGYLTCIVAGVDDRFQFAAPVYGCGFLGENSAWLGDFERLGPERAAKWLQNWDPSRYLPRAKMPFLWVTGTNDFAYPFDSLQKSYRLPSGPRTLAIRVRMPHGHGGAGENPEEIRAFADHLFKNAPPLALITAQGREGARAWAAFTSPVPVVKAELNFTRDAGVWKERRWESVPADLDGAAGKVGAAILEGTTVFYLNLIDDRGLVVSTEHIVTTSAP